MGGNATGERRVKIWRKEKMPSKLNQALIYPLHKNQDSSNKFTNCREITFLNRVYKVIVSTIKEGIDKKGEKVLGQYRWI